MPQQPSLCLVKFPPIGAAAAATVVGLAIDPAKSLELGIREI